MLERLFKLSEHNTTVRTEVLAGLTTFTTMAYILMVNAGMFAELGEVSYGAAYIATALSAVVGTILIGLVANLPLAQAAGMGPNAFFVYTVCLEMGFSYANALLFIMLDGLILTLMTVTGLRRRLFDVIPPAIKTAIPAGIGMFIAFVGLRDSGLIVSSASTSVGLASFNLLGGAAWPEIMPLLVTILTVISIGLLAKKAVKGAILWSLLGGGALYYALGAATSGGVWTGLAMGPLDAFREFGRLSLGKIFSQGFDFSAYLAQPGHSPAGLILAFSTTALAFCMVDIFNTMGTLYGACRSGGLLVENAAGQKEPPHMNKAMLANAISICTGAICGTSTLTPYVESAAGIAVGGRTGLTSMVVGALFLLAMFLSPLAALIPACAYAAVLVYVGVLMIGCVRDIEWSDPAAALPAFLTIVMMAFSYNIAYGIEFGLLSYGAIHLFTERDKQLHPVLILITLLFAATFFFSN